MKYTTVHTLSWANAEQTLIACVVNFDGIGEVEFSAGAEDVYAHTREIFQRAVAGDFGEVAAYEPQAQPQPTPEQITAIYSAAGQALLDSVAKAWQYNDIASAATYLGSNVPKFAAEAAALVDWRDAFWWAAEQLMAAIQADTESLPATPVAFLALMPAAPERPTV